MNNGFNDSEFLAYLAETFNGFENCFLRDIIENILQYGHKYNHISKGQFIYFLYDLIPQLDTAEIAQFASDEILTDALIFEKSEFLKSRGE